MLLRDSLPPVAVFAHKRPAHLQAALEAIQVSEQLLGYDLPLYIFCDRARKPEDEKGVSKTIALAKAHGRGEVIVREENKGFRNITEGISQLCETHGKVIVIEDDVLVSPDFLPFICSALERYANDPKVSMVSGFMYFDAQPKAPSSFFLQPSFIWGWATWKRAWDLFDWDCPDFEKVRSDKKRRYHYDCYGSMPFSKGLEKTMSGKWEAWGPRWMYAIEKAGGLSLYPHQSLAWNCGCGGGTHGSAQLDYDPTLGDREVYIHGNLERDDFRKPRVSPSLYQGHAFPKKVAEDKKALRYLAITFFKERLRIEKRKRWRLRLKLFFQRAALLCTPRPKR